MNGAPARGLTYLIVGCGSIGRRHARNLRALGVGRILAHDPNQEQAAELAREGPATVCATLDAAYEKRPDVALVCAPTSLHLPLASQALTHGCHLFVEKPLSSSLDGVDAFLGAVRDRGRVLLVGYNLRFDPLMHRLEAWLREGRIGRPLSTRLHFGSYLPARHPWEDYRGGYGARRALGGGVILDAIHELDYALWLFGDPAAVSCVAAKVGDLEIDVEDVAEIQLVHPDAVVSIHLDFLQRPHRRWCAILGTDGRITADLVGRVLIRYDTDGRVRDRYRNRCSPDEVYVREMRHFLRCLDGTDSPAVDGSVAVRSLRIADLAKASARSGQVMPLEPLGAGRGA